jgi:hypothetical protein
MAAEDNSFVKQSLTETLAGPSSGARLVPKASLNRTRKLINPKDMAIRKAKADEESGGILKSLGLTPTKARRTAKSSDKEAVTDWEEVDPPEALTEPIHLDLLSASTTKSHPSRRPTSIDSSHPAKTDSESIHLNSRHQPSSDPTSHHHQSSPKLNESSTIISLRRQLAESEKAREELASRNTQLECELNELRGDDKLKTDGKVLGAREYQELERQFDAQEKVRSPPLSFFLFFFFF